MGMHGVYEDMTPQQRYRERNREKLRERSKQRYKRTFADPDALRRRTEKKFDLPEGEINRMLIRQGGRCLITQKPFEDKPRAFCVDHDHETGEVRGLLSQKANSALGFLEEDPESFYRAVAYLTLDRSKHLIYVIGSLRNPSVTDVASRLREEGYDAFDNWFSAGEKADDSWQDYSRRKGLSYTEALQSREANHVFRFDKAYLDLCDAVVLVLPAGKSGFLELGYSVGNGKPSYILLDEETENNRYDVMPQFADMITSDIDLIVEDLNGRFRSEV